MSLQTLRNLDTNQALTKDQRLAAIKLIYKNIADQIMDRFVAKLQNEQFQHQKATVSVRLSADELSTLNREGKVVVNLASRYSSFGLVNNQANRILYDINLTTPTVKVAGDPNANVVVSLNILNNEALTSYNGNDYKFVMGNNGAPLFSSLLNIDPNNSSVTSRVDTKYDVEEFFQMTGIIPKAGDDLLYESYYTKPSLETQVLIENRSAVPLSFQNLGFNITYGYIPQTNIKYIQIIGCESLLPLVVLENTSVQQKFYFKNNVIKSFPQDQNVTLTAQKYVGGKIFDHWEDYLGKKLGTSPSYTPPKISGYTILKPVYQ